MSHIHGLPQELFGRTLHSLREVCNRRGIFPSSLVFSGEVSKLTTNLRVGAGEHAKVWSGKMNLKNENRIRVNVCLRAMRIGEVRKVGDRSPLRRSELLVEILQELYGEVALWVKLDHPNILQCFGITLHPLQIVTEWMPNGDVMEYLRERRGTDRIRLVSCHLFSAGVIIIGFEFPFLC